MVDIHHHLLPGLDDGALDLETSISMARLAAADGITHIICTPHASSRYAFSPALIAEKLSTLRSALAAESIPITLATGCDFHLSYDNIKDAIANPRKYSLNAGDYLLIELPDHGLSTSLEEIFYQLRLAGLILILTHPERNPTLQRDHARLAAWLREGMFVQITAGSLLGRFGETARKMSHALLTSRWVHFLATDAHNLTSRPPLLSEARDLVAARYGEAYAARLCTENPTAVFNGLAMPEQDEPIYGDAANDAAPWWKRILGKN
jgi:protein-tyrosine phosphatase